MNENGLDLNDYISRYALDRYYREPLRHYRVDRSLIDFDLEIGDIEIAPRERHAMDYSEVLRTMMEVYARANVQIVMSDGVVKKKNLLHERRTKLVPTID